jgi:hypothetical protein
MSYHMSIGPMIITGLHMSLYFICVLGINPGPFRY